MKTLAIFGSTGSIGKTALKVYELNKNKFDLVCLSAHSNIKKLLSQNNKFNTKNLVLTSLEKNYGKIKTFDCFLKLQKKKIDYVISGFSGFEALDLNLKLLKFSKNLLIANKETIICGGKYFIKESAKKKCKIIPIDSEHHCINFFLNNIKSKKVIKNFFITASGGPFLNKKFNDNEPIKNVLRHPTWRMGKEISVASSNLSNKVLEIFEARVLFNLKASDIKIIIEKNSNIHVIVEFKNNIMLPIIHSPSMIIPISNALGVSNNFKFSLKNRNFLIQYPDLKKFPIITLGYKILSMKEPNGMIIFTVLNERLIKLYLNNKIKYSDILKKKLSNINHILKFIKILKNIKYANIN